MTFLQTLLSAMALAAALSSPTQASAASSGSFSLLHHLPVNGVADIVAATPNGMTLLYTREDSGTLGVVDQIQLRQTHGFELRRCAD